MLTLRRRKLKMYLTERDYILGVWFVGGNGRQDFLATVRKKENGKVWDMEYRFRYYNGVDAWESEDDKSFYTATLKGDVTEEEVIKTLRKMTAKLSEVGFGETIDEILVRGNPDKLMCDMGQRDWCHIAIGKKGSKEARTHKGKIISTKNWEEEYGKDRS